MREVYTYKQLKCYWYPLWKTGALRQSRALLLAPDFSKLFSRATSNEGRPADGLSTANCFFLQQQDSLALASSYDIRDADSRAGCSITNSWSFNSFCTKPTLPCIFGRLPSWYNFLSARLQVCNYGASFYTNCSPRVKLRAVLNSICGRNGSDQQADPSLREKVSLREQRMTHKILHTCHCPLQFLKTDCNPIERDSKDGMQFLRTLHH